MTIVDKVAAKLRGQGAVIACVPVELAATIMPDFLERAAADGPYVHGECKLCACKIYVGRRSQQLLAERAADFDAVCITCCVKFSRRPPDYLLSDIEREA
jgi:hypothetical protein